MVNVFHVFEEEFFVTLALSLVKKQSFYFWSNSSFIFLQTTTNTEKGNNLWVQGISSLPEVSFYSSFTTIYQSKPSNRVCNAVNHLHDPGMLRQRRQMISSKTRSGIHASVPCASENPIAPPLQRDPVDHVLLIYFGVSCASCPFVPLSFS